MVQAEPVVAASSARASQAAADPAEVFRRRGAPRLELTVTSDFAAVADEWRAFEQHADCTVFQSYDWLAAWLRHIGSRSIAETAVVIGRSGGETQFILPLAVIDRTGHRQLTFLARDVGDYNAPLLAFDFGKRYPDFAGLWAEIHALLQQDGRWHHDVVSFDRMPETVGRQPNPLLQLGVRAHPSSAYLTSLADNWDSFYTTKRSASTRRRDRTKRKKLAELGEIRMVTPQAEAEITATTEALIAQKQGAFRRMGVVDIFSRPGWAEFFREIPVAAGTRPIVHVSRLDVGSVPAATNLGLVFRGSYYHVLASYDDGPLARFGPGVAHLHELMSYAIDRGCGTFDFTVGDEAYKRDWCDTELKLYDYVAGVTVRGRAIGKILAVGRTAKRAIKQSPILWPAAMKLRALVGSMKRRRGDR
jgi:CelD/BcsL family acetyltransferase involved in cellulose biosynthesis